MKTKTFQPTQTLLLLATLSAALMGCGPNLMGSDVSNAQSNRGVYTGYTNGSLTSNGSYSCPASPNVTPYEDRLFNGTQYYTACPNSSATTQVEVSGNSSSSDVVCVYPLWYYDDSNFTYVPGPNGQPLFSCYNARTTSVQNFDFQQTTFNGLAIVDQDQQANLSRCLTTGITCPTYSVGRIR